ncbi:IclR family transcriptional regulator [Ideonella sp. A 288]|uniref:IclR family transcriptional regulator n=1 Tax=Ideonella sp. A 288 TaxID=1962181 RepID=UPI001303B51B|nr:IclR family transcriptional regulator [Ideonella sp. A 288]
MRQASDTNAAQKVCRLLRALSTPVPQRLADIAEGSGVNKATALRLLESLIGEGFVVRDEATKRYTLGDEALALGIAMQGRDHIRDRARPTLLRLAAATGDTMLLSTRSGIESVCVDREFGSYPIRANYLDLGMRRPLGVGAGSLALLAWLPDDEVDAVLPLIAPRIAKRYPRITVDLLKTEVQLARQRGYALLLDVVVDQMGGIGVPVFGSDGRPMAAISLAALTSRITPRLAQLVPLLRKAGEDLSREYAQKDAA